MELIERTTHRPENGGYEHWSFSYKDTKYLLYCDIRIPGIISSYYQPLPDDLSKVIVVNLFKVNTTDLDDLHLEEVIDPTIIVLEDQIMLREIIKEILLTKIKPIRDFAYIAFVVSNKDKDFYQDLLNDITEASPGNVYQLVYDILEPETQTFIDAKSFELLLGKIKPV